MRTMSRCIRRSFSQRRTAAWEVVVAAQEEVTQEEPAEAEVAPEEQEVTQEELAQAKLAPYEQATTTLLLLGLC